MIKSGSLLIKRKNKFKVIVLLVFLITTGLAGYIAGFAGTFFSGCIFIHPVLLSEKSYPVSFLSAFVLLLVYLSVVYFRGLEKGFLVSLSYVIFTSGFAFFISVVGGADSGIILASLGQHLFALILILLSVFLGHVSIAYVYLIFLSDKVRRSVIFTVLLLTILSAVLSVNNQVSSGSILDVAVQDVVSDYHMLDSDDSRFIRKENITLVTLEQISPFAILGGTVVAILFVLNLYRAFYLLIRDDNQFLESPMFSWVLNLSTRENTSFYNQELCNVDFSYVELSNIDLRAKKISHVIFKDAKGLERARVNNDYISLGDPKVKKLLTFQRLEIPCFSKAILREVYLQEADLIGYDFTDANLSNANLQGANLREAILIGTDLTGANLRGVELTNACIQDWNISSTTRFDGVICESVYLKFNKQERRPRTGAFKPGELATLFQQAIDTVDLIFQDGIDWQAFFQSFQDLRNQYADQDLSIQAIEKKHGGAFVIRLEVAGGADKSAVESDAKQLYKNQLAALESRYEKQLRLQGQQYSEEIQRLIAAERQEKATLMGVLSTMANNQGPKYDLSNAQFGGGFAETVQGNQTGGIINNYGASAEDITRLIMALRSQANTFPTEQKNEALDTLDALENDFAKPEPDQSRIGRRLKKLVTLAAAVGTLASGAAAVSGDLATFTTNIIELAETLGIPIEQVQIPPANSP